MSPCSIAAANTPISGCGRRGGLLSPILIFAILGVSIAPASAFADGCKLGKIAEFPIAMVGLRALMTASINDVDVQFVVDSGAFVIVPVELAETCHVCVLHENVEGQCV